MRAGRSRLLFQSLSEVGLYFGLEDANRTGDRFTCVHFSAKQGHLELF